MEERKLNDEEIIKDIERSTGMPSYWKKIVLDLIHRLNGENKKPKRKKILANRVYSDATLKGWKKEDLIEQIRILEHNWAAAEGALNNSAKNSDKIFAEQKAEIERLKRYEMTESEFQKYCAYKIIEPQIRGCLDRERELQKQVDELKAENGHLHKLIVEEMVSVKAVRAAKNYPTAMKMLAESVGCVQKDTAKEILDDLRNIFIEQSSYGSDTNQHIGYYDYEVKMGLIVEQIEEYAKEKYGIEYGVEVE